MKKLMKHLLMGIACMMLVIGIGAVPAMAAPVLKNYEGTDKTLKFSRDLNYDDVKDSMKITMVHMKGDMSDFADHLNIYMNGTKVGSVPCEYSFYYFVTYIKMSSKKEFLQIITLGNNDQPVSNNIYRYDTKKKKMVSCAELNTGLSCTFDTVEVSSSYITLTNLYQPIETGYISWNVKYTYADGMFTPTSDTGDAVSLIGDFGIEDKYNKYFKKNQFICAKKRSFYTSTSLKKVAFTAEKKDKVTLKQVCVKGSKIYASFSNGKKTGWIRLNNDFDDVYSYNSASGSYSNRYFYGVLNRLAG